MSTNESAVREALERLLAVRNSLKPGSKLDPDAVQDAWWAAERALAASAAQPGVSGGEALDAARYRWMRSSDFDMSCVSDDDTQELLSGCELDDAIDAMRPGLPLATPPAETGSGATHSDDVAVDRFSRRMKWKLEQKRHAGREGWEKCEPAYLSQLLREHVEKGDPVDVANFCMMLAARNEPITQPPDTTPAASGQAVAQEAVAWMAHGIGGWALLFGHADAVAYAEGGDVKPLYAHPAPSAASVRAEALEEAAKVCDMEDKACGNPLSNLSDVVRGYRQGARTSAERIRALQTPHASREGRADG